MLKAIELVGFKSFAKKSELKFDSRISSIVGPNGSGKSNVAEGFRFVLGEQSMKSLRSKRGEDLIWGGSPALPRANRAAVKVTFDNSKKILDIDFEEVAIERIVHRDGQNEYLINGSKVRLKDVVRLLAGANIAGTGYQIISQGEADRILTASARERREMVEDALGLKLYQHKKTESERKLEETEQNIEKVESLRRELAPHLKFLRRQVEKIEKARELKEELVVQLSEYLARENAWIETEDARIKDEREEVDAQLAEIEQAMSTARTALPEAIEEEGNEHEEEIAQLEQRLAETRRAREALARELGRAETRAELENERDEEALPRAEVRSFVYTLRELVERAHNAHTQEEAHDALREAREQIDAFSARTGESGGGENSQANAELLRVSKELSDTQENERALAEEIKGLQTQVVQETKAKHEAERELLTLEANKRECTGRQRALVHAAEDVKRAKQSFEEEVREGIVLLGEEVQKWKQEELPQNALSEDRGIQEKRRRDVERLKIKIEESGLGNSGEILKEFTQTKERDEFLGKEVEDLVQSAESLRNIIEELDAKIDERFQAGLARINEALQEFFSKLFGGGEARLDLEKVDRRRPSADELDGELSLDEPEDTVRGLTIHVQLPRKRIKGLEVLSGGERALTSIALIFAMSQVNPPPFLILDETDAALDEANSRRYADMVRALGERSQLILITHNRATMAAAGELYGVTMGADGVSKLLSVKLEEAEKVAK